MESLPDEIVARVLALLPCHALRKVVSLTCRRWAAIARDRAALGGADCTLMAAIESRDLASMYFSGRQAASARTRTSRWCDAAAACGHVGCIEYASARGHVYGCKAAVAAARAGRLGVLRHALKYARLPSVSECEAAAAGGHLDCLAYLHEVVKCPWDWRVPAAAAANGHLACLVYAHQRGCPWDHATCEAAAQWGRLDCLRYAHEHGCAWRKATCEAAAEGGHRNCLAYARANGCQWDAGTIIAAARRGHVPCVAYIIEQGCGLDWCMRAFKVAITRRRSDVVRLLAESVDEGAIALWTHTQRAQA